MLKAVRESDAFDQLKEDASARVGALVREVESTHAGMPVADVDAELRRRFEESGVTPEEPGFTEVVTAIASGERTG